MSDPLKVARRGPVFEMVLDRPKVNAIDRVTSVRMGEAFCDFKEDPDLWVAIVTGAGDRIFSAGWDLASATEGEHERMDYGPGGFAGLYPGTFDYLPVLEESLPELITAAGFSGTGLMHAPAIGEIVADMVSGRTPGGIDISSLGSGRFSKPSSVAETSGF